MNGSCYSAFERLWFIIERLKSNKSFTLIYVAESFECSVRSVKRDIVFLRERLGMNVQWDRQRNTYYLAKGEYVIE